MSGSTTQDAKHRALAEGRGEGLLHTYLVEAGAGTGKTSVLITRLISLVRAGFLHQPGGRARESICGARVS